MGYLSLEKFLLIQSFDFQRTRFFYAGKIFYCVQLLISDLINGCRDISVHLNCGCILPTLWFSPEPETVRLTMYTNGRNMTTYDNRILSYNDLVKRIR